MCTWILIKAVTRLRLVILFFPLLLLCKSKIKASVGCWENVSHISWGRIYIHHLSLILLPLQTLRLTVHSVCYSRQYTKHTMHCHWTHVTSHFHSLSAIHLVMQEYSCVQGQTKALPTLTSIDWRAVIVAAGAHTVTPAFIDTRQTARMMEINTATARAFERGFKKPSSLYKCV